MAAVATDALMNSRLVSFMNLPPWLQSKFDAFGPCSPCVHGLPQADLTRMLKTAELTRIKKLI